MLVGLGYMLHHHFLLEAGPMADDKLETVSLKYKFSLI